MFPGQPRATRRDADLREALTEQIRDGRIERAAANAVLRRMGLEPSLGQFSVRLTIEAELVIPAEDAAEAYSRACLELRTTAADDTQVRTHSQQVVAVQALPRRPQPARLPQQRSAGLLRRLATGRRLPGLPDDRVRRRGR
jgi:hypothetical protein